MADLHCCRNGDLQCHPSDGIGHFLAGSPRLISFKQRSIRLGGSALSHRANRMSNHVPTQPTPDFSASFVRKFSKGAQSFSCLLLRPHDRI